MIRRLVLSLAVLAWAVPGSAQLPPCAEFAVNEFTTGHQRFVNVGSSPNGDFVVVWESLGQDGNGAGIFARRYDAAGGPLGAEFRVNSYTTGSQINPAAAVDAGGSFVVVWSGGGIFGQRYDALGTPQGTEFQVNTYTGTGANPSYPAVAADPSGGFVVVWHSFGQDGNNRGVFGQRYDSSGAPQGAEFQVNTYTPGYQQRPAVSADASGRFVVVWESADQDGNLTGVYGQRFDADGTRLGAEFRVNTYTFQDQRDPQVAHGPNGDFVVVWDRFGAIGLGIFAQRYDAAGTPRGGEFQVNTATVTEQYRPAIAGDPAQGYVVVWTGVGGPGDGSGRGVFGRRLNAVGAPSGASFVVNSFTAGDQAQPAIAGGPNGGFVAVWESFNQDASFTGVFGSVECSRLYTVSPCRLVDTRDPPATPLAANTARSFAVTGTCNIPPDARAVALNVTAVNPTDLGNLRVFPAGSAAPLASSVNFVPGRTRSNNAIIPVGADGRVTVQCDMPPGSPGATHLLLDVSGYFKR